MSSIENAKKIKEVFGCTIPTSFSMGHGIFELTLSKSRLSYVSVIPVDFNISYIDDRIVQSTSILSPKVISLIDYQTLNMFDGSDEEFEAFMLWKINILDKITSDIDYFIDRTGSRMTINYIRNIWHLTDSIMSRWNFNWFVETWENNMIFKYNDDGTVNILHEDIEYTNCYYKDIDGFDKQDIIIPTTFEYNVENIPQPFNINFIENGHHSVKNCFDNWVKLIDQQKQNDKINGEDL